MSLLETLTVSDDITTSELLATFLEHAPQEPVVEIDADTAFVRERYGDMRCGSLVVQSMLMPVTEQLASY